MINGTVSIKRMAELVGYKKAIKRAIYYNPFFSDRATTVSPYPEDETWFKNGLINGYRFPGFRTQSDTSCIYHP